MRFEKKNTPYKRLLLVFLFFKSRNLSVELNHQQAKLTTNGGWLAARR